MDCSGPDELTAAGTRGGAAVAPTPSSNTQWTLDLNTLMTILFGVIATILQLWVLAIKRRRYILVAAFCIRISPNMKYSNHPNQASGQSSPPGGYRGRPRYNIVQRVTEEACGCAVTRAPAWDSEAESNSDTPVTVVLGNKERKKEKKRQSKIKRSFSGGGCVSVF